SEQLSRVLVRDNLMYDVNDTHGPGWAVFMNATLFGPGQLLGPDYVSIEHNTLLASNAYVSSDSGEHPHVFTNFVFQNNLVANGVYGFLASGISQSAESLTTLFVDPVFTANAIIGGDPDDYAGLPGLFLPPSIAAVQFVNEPARIYQLAPTSPFVGAGNDGRDLGVDWAALSAATACAVSGVCAPAISNITITGLTGTAAVVNWTTDQPTDGQVEFGLTAAYGSTTAIDPSLTATHGLGVSGLTPATTYHFRVRSTNSVGLTSISGDGTFTTVAPPAINGVNATGLTTSGATIGWTTNQLADSQVEYGLTA